MKVLTGLIVDGKNPEFLLHHQQTRNHILSSTTLQSQAIVCLFHQLLCPWETVKSEENMSKWKALRIEPSSSWQSPMHAPQLGLCAWPLRRQWSPGQERETRPSNLQCNTLCTKLLCLSLCSLKPSLVFTFSWTWLALCRCIQDPDVLVNVSQTMSLQYTPPPVSEDCLYLNVYAPAEAQRGDKLPVRLAMYSIKLYVCAVCAVCVYGGRGVCGGL